MPGPKIPKREKKRLDLLLVERGLAESRNKAQALILAGLVQVPSFSSNLLKPGSLFPEDTPIDLISPPKYVSRGGDKLEGALTHWKISPDGIVCLDIGSSTGGFTDCLLQNGARKVYAVDVGYGQAHPKIRDHPKVALFEQTHILKWQAPWANAADHSPAPSLCVIDVSFISLEKILNRVYELMGPGSQIIALVKPQFEVGQKHLKKGIVKDEGAREKAITRVSRMAEEVGFQVQGRFPCPVPGMKGNQEEWLYLRKD